MIYIRSTLTGMKAPKLVSLQDPRKKEMSIRLHCIYKQVVRRTAIPCCVYPPVSTRREEQHVFLSSGCILFLSYRGKCCTWSVCTEDCTSSTCTAPSSSCHPCTGNDSGNTAEKSANPGRPFHTLEPHFTIPRQELAAPSCRRPGCARLLCLFVNTWWR